MTRAIVRKTRAIAPMTHAIIWKNLENITPRGQTQGATYDVIAFV